MGRETPLRHYVTVAKTSPCLEITLSIIVGIHADFNHLADR